MTTFTTLLLTLPPALVLLAAALLPAVEASVLVGLVVPGETAVFVAGMTSHAGHLPLVAVMVAAALGAVAGDQIGFGLGRRWGPHLLEHLPHRAWVGVRAARTLDLVRRRGGWAVLLGRWTAVLRALVPGLAGASGMSRRTFTLTNLAGGVTWAVVVAGLGYGAGAAYPHVVAVLGRAGEVAVGLVVVAALLTAAGRRMRRHHRDRIGRQVGPA